MTKQHNHDHKAPSKFDLLQWMRKPHGIALVALVIGVAGWAIWTFWVLPH